MRVEHLSGLKKLSKDYPNEEAKRGYIEGKFKSGIAREIRKYLNKPISIYRLMYFMERCARS